MLEHEHLMKGFSFFFFFFGSPFSCFFFVVVFSFFSYFGVQRFPEMKMIFFIIYVYTNIGNIYLFFKGIFGKSPENSITGN